MSNRKTIGTLYGLLGMLSFSLTLPATRAAVLYFHPAVVAFVRPVVAAVLAAALLIIMGKRPPARRYWKSFALVVLGVVIGVPLTFAWGMHNLPGSPRGNHAGSAAAGHCLGRHAAGWRACLETILGGQLHRQLRGSRIRIPAGCGHASHRRYRAAPLGDRVGCGLCGRSTPDSRHAGLGGDELGPGYGRAVSDCSCRAGDKRLRPQGSSKRVVRICLRVHWSASGWACSPGTRAWPRAASPASDSYSCCSPSARDVDSDQNRDRVKTTSLRANKGSG